MNAPMIGGIGIVAGCAAGYLVRHFMGRYGTDSQEREAERILNDAKKNAQTMLKESEIHAKSELVKVRDEFEKGTENKRKELLALEKRVAERELGLDRKVTMIEKKERAVEEKTEQLNKQESQIRELRAEADKLVAEERDRLQRIARMTRDEARSALLALVEKDVQSDTATLVRRLQDNARETAEQEAKKIIATAIQRFASSHSSELTTSSVALRDEEMKGRIIGRDGRNVRCFEAATGVNILVDDTPDAVVLSAFDPIRREVARQALELLLADGRIHPARIEEVVAKVQENMDETVRKIGEKTLYECGITEANPEVVRMLGRLHFRSSYGQNVLQHCVEVSHLMGMMAGELGLDVTVAKRIGLLHDVGKALTHEVEGGHAVIGADLLKRHGETPMLVNAVAAHHEEVPAESVYALLASAADAMSSARLGARTETTETYIRRLEKLESVANSFGGVKKSYAIQAGREVRVIVEPVVVDDNGSIMLARDIAKKIESDLQYPGQIRVVVIRETRCVEYAR